ncbi:MAG: hypothetical protein HY978_03415 [Candidatus Liptonbacteria bacterium]|nr:hypothetical protein [Candidatus Liptonbacteria bacterium]
MRKKKLSAELLLEDALVADVPREAAPRTLPLPNRPLVLLGVFFALTAAIVAWRILDLGILSAAEYRELAEGNLIAREREPAPRGQIFTRTGTILADNEAAFAAVLDIPEFLNHPEEQDPLLEIIYATLGVPPKQVWESVREQGGSGKAEPVVLEASLTQGQLITFMSSNYAALRVRGSFRRVYPYGASFAPAVGYTSSATVSDLRRAPDLSGQDVVGRGGVEGWYDTTLRGQPGISVTLRDAKGRALETKEQQAPRIGQSLTLTLDEDFQEYFKQRLQAGLDDLGRTSGVGLAMDPRNGEVLALVSLPSYDPNILVASGRNSEKKKLLTNPAEPLFNRAVAGLYSPGSTIKPLVGVAALAEGVVTPSRTIYSPGYLEVPNPFYPDQPSRFLDWRPQGTVGLRSAIAQSSNVYFYLVGGGGRRDQVSPPEILAGQGEIKGLGIVRLREWWQKFGLDQPTGIDLAAEATGFLPSPEWKEKTADRPWRLGDTYNVAIGQGDITVTPIELLNYIAAIANGGKLYQPHLNASSTPSILADLTRFAPEIREVQKGMRLGVTSPLGTSYKLNDLPFAVAGKTGSAQIQNNTKTNAFFVGYIPQYVRDPVSFPPRNKYGVNSRESTISDNSGPPLAILILIENAREGSLNTVPIAKDVLWWYWAHRLIR